MYKVIHASPNQHRLPDYVLFYLLFIIYCSRYIKTKSVIEMFSCCQTGCHGYQGLCPRG